MTDIACTPAADLFALDLWEDAAEWPGPGRAGAFGSGIAMRVGPRRWWIEGADVPDIPAERGALTAIGGGWMRVMLTGANWREVIEQAGLIDARYPALAPGSVVATVLSHADCVLHVHSPLECAVYVPASMAGHCLGAWREFAGATGQHDAGTIGR